jgi:uncharacterized protein (DUF2062 family)
MNTMQITGQIVSLGIWFAFLLAIAVAYVVHLFSERRERRAAERRRVADGRRKSTVARRVPARSTS